MRQPERTELERAAGLFVPWLARQVEIAGRGEALHDLEVEPSGAFWLGRLAPEAAVLSLGLGDRGERLDPCATGCLVRPAGPPPWRFVCLVSCRAWLRQEGRRWTKSEGISVPIDVSVEPGDTSATYGRSLLEASLQDVASSDGLSAEIRVDVESDAAGVTQLAILLVNVSDPAHSVLKDTNLYEARLVIQNLPSQPFILEALPDSFRYDRRVAAYGINGGVVVSDSGELSTSDTFVADRGRPTFWGVPHQAPDLTFATLESDPLPSLTSLVEALAAWGVSAWDESADSDRGEIGTWDEKVREEFSNAKSDFEEELARIRRGLGVLEGDSDAQLAFRLMNRAMFHTSRGRYDRWRAFQVGFILATIESVTDPEPESPVADIVWFQTGGGKTETYLGLLVFASLYDRLKGKSAGITAWSRFPLRMLSLQQTQRFADAMAGAELARRNAAIPGDSFATGFFVGQGATPNKIPLDATDDQPDSDDDTMPLRYKVLLHCPFCFLLSCRWHSIDVAGRLSIVVRIQHVHGRKSDCPSSSSMTRSTDSYRASWWARSTRLLRLRCKPR